MDSPYEKHLRATIASAPDEMSAALAKAELAGYLARLGRFDHAETAIREIRERYGDGRSARVTIMLMCAEAQVLYFRQMHPDARDRLARAQLLSVAGGDRPLTALTSAWLAHIDFNHSRYASMVKAIATCVSSLRSGDASAKCRLALTLADAFLTAGDRPVSHVWYAKAHELAVQLGDHAAMAALTMNRAVLGVFNARLREEGVLIDTADLSRLDAEVRSASNYEAAAGLTSLKALLDNASVSILLMQSQHGPAASRIEGLLAGSPVVSPGDSTALLQCDLAMCYASLGRNQDAERLIKEEGLCARLDASTPDDRFLGFATLRRASLRVGLSDLAESFAGRAERSKLEYQENVTSLSSMLRPYRSTDVLAGAPA